MNLMYQYWLFKEKKKAVQLSTETSIFNLKIFKNLGQMRFNSCQNIRILENLRLSSYQPIFSSVGYIRNHGGKKRERK